ncbi:MAG: branched-chain amino acid ABC transporter permease [Chloroflexi bacterium]|nr:branched-chain amino acid ABC transporter permease [Chloroflexota bacterium]
MNEADIHSLERVKRTQGGVSWLREIVLDWDKVQVIATMLALIAIGCSPLAVKSPYYMSIIILTVIYAYVGITWNIVAGLAGQLMIAHLIFVGIGAYTTIVLLERFYISPWIGIPLSALTAGLLGFLVAIITLRYGLKADYFALFGIALMTVLRVLFMKIKFIGGGEGIWLTLSGQRVERMEFVGKAPYLYIGLGILLFGILAQYAIHRSKMGKYFLAIREDEAAAAALGVNTALYKTLAVTIGTAMAGLGGGFYVMYIAFVDPPSVFNLAYTVEMALAAPIIGGLGTLAGPVFGAILNKPFAELIRGWLSAERAGSSLIVYGAFLIFFVLFLPRGVVGLLQRPYEKLRQRLLASAHK